MIVCHGIELYYSYVDFEELFNMETLIYSFVKDNTPNLKVLTTCVKTHVTWP